MSEFLDKYIENFSELPELEIKLRTDGKEESSVSSELIRLDQSIINYVNQKYPSLIIPDINEFIHEFCNDHPYRGSIVEARVVKLKERGWK